MRTLPKALDTAHAFTYADKQNLSIMGEKDMRNIMLTTVIFLVCFSAVPTSIKAQSQQIPTEEEILWRAVLESQPTIRGLVIIVRRQPKPFAGWAYKELIHRTRTNLTAQLGAMREILTLCRLNNPDTNHAYIDSAVTIILRNRSEASPRLLSLAIYCTTLGQNREAFIEELVVRDSLSGLISFDLIRILEQDVSVKNKSKVARILLEKRELYSKFPKEHLPTSVLVIIIREAPEPWKERAFVQLWEKPWGRIVGPLQVEQNILEDVPEPYRSRLEFLKSLPAETKEIYPHRILPQR